MLSIDDNERIVSRTVRAGGRWVAEVDVYVDDATNTATLGALPEPEGQLVSVDECGGDRRVLATDLLWARHTGADEDSVWIGCEQQTRELSWVDLDPDLGGPARSLGPSGDPMDPFEGLGPAEPYFECGRWLRVDREIWLERPTSGGLPTIAHLTVPIGGDPIEQEVLEARWIDARDPGDADEGPPELFVRVGTELRALDLSAGTEEVLLEVDTLEEVRVAQGRYIRITDLVSTAFRIVDRDTGRVVEGDVSETEASHAGEGWSTGPGMMVRRDTVSTAVWLPELEVDTLFGPWSQPRRLDDGRVVLFSEADSSIHVLDGPGTAPRKITGILVRYYGIVDEAAVGIVARPEVGLDLVAYPLDGSGERLLAHRVDGVQAVIGDRWATMRDGSSDGGELLLIDADGTDLGRVDTDVAMRFGPTFVQEVGRFEPTPSAPPSHPRHPG